MPRSTTNAGIKTGMNVLKMSKVPESGNVIAAAILTKVKASRE